MSHCERDTFPHCDMRYVHIFPVYLVVNYSLPNATSSYHFAGEASAEY